MMGEFVNIIRTLINSGDNHLEVYLDILDDQRIGEKGYENELQIIHSLLMSASSRLIGIKLLNIYLKQCPTTVIEQKLNFYITLVLKAVPDYGVQAAEVYTTLKNLLIISQRSQELIKSFSSTYLAKYYEALVNAKYGILEALECIELCLQYYPESSGFARNSVEKFLLGFIGTTDKDINASCGKCLHQLQSVRASNMKGISNKDQWKNYQLKLVGSIHAILADLYANQPEMYDGSIVNEKLCTDMEELSKEPTERAMQLYINLRNLTEYLAITLCAPFSAEKTILPETILNLIVRGLGVTQPMMVANATSDQMALGLLLPKVHFCFLRVLQAVVITLSSHVRVYYKVILNLLLDTLKVTSSRPINLTRKSVINLRIKAYELVRLWCLLMKSGSRVEAIADFLIIEIFKDIYVPQNGLSLKVVNNESKEMHKNVQRKWQKSQNMKFKLAAIYTKDVKKKSEDYWPDKCDKIICFAALQCLQQFLISASNFVKPNVIQVIQTKILQISSLFNETPIKTHNIYGDWKCRLEILNTLNTLIEMPHHLCPPPTEIVFNILQTTAVRDGNENMRNECVKIISNLMKYVHPLKDSLIYPTDILAVKNEFFKLKQDDDINSNCRFNRSNYTEQTDDTIISTNVANAKLLNIVSENIDSLPSDINSIEQTTTLKETPMETDSSHDCAGIIDDLVQQINDSSSIENINIIESDNSAIIQENGEDTQYKADENEILPIVQASLDKNLHEKADPPMKIDEEDSKDSADKNLHEKADPATPSKLEEQSLIEDIEAAFIDELNDDD